MDGDMDDDEEIYSDRRISMGMKVCLSPMMP